MTYPYAEDDPRHDPVQAEIARLRDEAVLDRIWRGEL